MGCDDSITKPLMNIRNKKQYSGGIFIIVEEVIARIKTRFTIQRQKNQLQA
jgi:hypothetical protein